MIKISQIIRDTIETNDLLQFGITNNLFNLTHLANFIKPLIEIKLKKNISAASLIMELSRQQRIFKKISPRIEDFSVKHLSIFTGLNVFTFLKEPKVHKMLSQLYLDVLKDNSHITLQEGNREITLIIDQKYQNIILEKLKTAPVNFRENISGLSVTFSEKYSETPGFVHSLLQQLSLQNINIIEISSTFSEIIFYFDNRDIKIAFETIYNRFSQKR